jgi:cytochrome c553
MYPLRLALGTSPAQPRSLPVRFACSRFAGAPAAASLAREPMASGSTAGVPTAGGPTAHAPSGALTLSAHPRRRAFETAALSVAMLLAVSGPVEALPPLPQAEAAAIAQAEYDEVMRLTPDIDAGRSAYLTCAVCHLPEGWGTVDGRYPQIAGQLRTVIIKQLADFRAGNRDNPLMYPFSVPDVLGGPQQIADVAAYVASLPMTPHNSVGPGADLERGKALYEENCVDCHGGAGEGDVEKHIPAIAGQHFPYLMRQFDHIRAGQRRNSDPEMMKQIQGFTPHQQAAVLDYTSRLRPAAEKLAAEGWTNPDFPHYARNAMGLPAPPPAPPPAPAMMAPPTSPMPMPPAPPAGRVPSAPEE